MNSIHRCPTEEQQRTGSQMYGMWRSVLPVRTDAERYGMSGCPLHNLVPEWNDLVYTGNWEEAYYRLYKTNNFPEFTGRVCPALCEACLYLRSEWRSGRHQRQMSMAIIENAYEIGYAQARPPKAAVPGRK